MYKFVFGLLETADDVDKRKQLSFGLSLSLRLRQKRQHDWSQKYAHSEKKLKLCLQAVTEVPAGKILL